MGVLVAVLVNDAVKVREGVNVNVGMRRFVGVKVAGRAVLLRYAVVADGTVVRVNVTVGVQAGLQVIAVGGVTGTGGLVMLYMNISVPEPSA